MRQQIAPLSTPVPSLSLWAGPRCPSPDLLCLCKALKGHSIQLCFLTLSTSHQTLNVLEAILGDSFLPR